MERLRSVRRTGCPCTGGSCRGRPFAWVPRTSATPRSSAKTTLAEPIALEELNRIHLLTRSSINQPTQNSPQIGVWILISSIILVFACFIELHALNIEYDYSQKKHPATQPVRMRIPA